MARPAMQLGTAAIIINQCRGVKSAHEIEIMRFANQITLQAYREGFKTMQVGMSHAELVRNFAAEMTNLAYKRAVFALSGEPTAYAHMLPKPRTLAENQTI